MRAPPVRSHCSPFPQIEQGMDGSLHGARQHLHRMWLEWSRQDGVPMEDSQVFIFFFWGGG